jgi:two-component system sensor histidine kinase KdpD
MVSPRRDSVDQASAGGNTGSVFPGRFRLRLVAEFSVAIWALSLTTFCAFVLQLDFSTAGFLYLTIVVLTALFCGFVPATLTSLIAAGCLDYFFLPPVFSFDIGDSKNLVALAAFEFCALIVGRLSTREKHHALEARRQRNSMEKLYEVSRRTQQLDLHLPPGPQIVGMIRDSFELDYVALFDEALTRCDGSGNAIGDEEERAQLIYLEGIHKDDAWAGIWQRVLRADHRLTGGLYLRGKLDPLTADALASVTAIALERCGSYKKESQAEAARQSEQMRTAVLDALAHAFKTPLTAIRTASAGLLEIGNLSEPQFDLASLIDEQSAKLNSLATRLLQTAKLDASGSRLNTEQVMLSGLIAEVLSDQAGKLDQHPVEVTISDSALSMQGDRGLLATIVGQFVDNAAKYSLPGTPIQVLAESSHSQVLISVHNEGTPIRLEDRERIFERFYRCPETEGSVPGTGIGLSIARKAAEAHHGHVWVISSEGEGNTFFVSLPQGGGQDLSESARRVG